MTPTIVNLSSGATLEIQMAPFAVGTKLYKTIANELKSVEIGASLDLSALGNLDLNDVKSAIFQLLGSDAVEMVVFDCLKYALYNNAKIDRSTFDDADARGDFLPCAWEVVKFNLSPFFKNLDLSLLAHSKPTSAGQR